ncbi:MAG: L-2-amino-thiazoline-4-carboxylic acid hydrolase [Proteobacteria bacterium]|nr:L-2-amino-thiazoline-4-carboxylic acid hydrolase [Pseudomonadota bacterium]
MSKITNAPKRNNFILKAVRGTLEHRATWLYLLLKEAEKKGVKWEDIGYPATRACGNIQGKELINLSGTSSLKGLRKKLFTIPAQFVFEMKILESTDNKLSVDFGYCPLVAAWQKLGCTDENIGRLCDIAMEGDRGIAESFGGKLELGKTIANGHEKCQIKFIK